MTFKQFVAFVSAAKHLNITRAAEDLHTSQPSISKQLRLLQDDYSIRLYYKTNAGGIELTQEGREFLKYVRKIVYDLDALKIRFNHTSRTRARLLAVGGTYALASELLPLLLSEFKKTHPFVNVVLRTRSSFAIHAEILRGDIDVGLVARIPRSKHFEVQPYSTHRLVAFANTNSRYALAGELTAAELAGAPLILRGGHRLRGAAETVLKQSGYKANVVLRCETPEAVRIAVRNNLGVGILFHDAVKNAIERGEFKLLHIPGLVIEARSFIVYHKERPLSSAANDFLALLKKRKPEPKASAKS